MPKIHVLRLLYGALSVALAFGAVQLASSPHALAAPPAPSASAPPAPPAPAPAIDPKAMDLLKRSAEKMKSMTVFSVHADATKDDVVRDGFKVKRTMTEDLLVKKPDRMRAEVSGDDGRRLFVYDGKAVSLLTTPQNFYATVPGGATIADTLEAVTSRYDLELPLTDLLYMAAGTDVGKSATEAGVIGTSRVGGVECDQLAFRTKAVDWQLWIEKASLLPKKIVVTTRGVEAAPQYEAVLAWNPAPKIADADFEFKPPPGAVAIRVRTLGETPVQAKSPSETKDTKAKSGK